MDRNELLELAQDLIVSLGENRDEVPGDLYNKVLGGILTLATELMRPTENDPPIELRNEILVRMSELRPGVGISRHTLVCPLRPRWTTAQASEMLEQLESEGIIGRRLIKIPGPGRPTTEYFLTHEGAEL